MTPNRFRFRYRLEKNGKIFSEIFDISSERDLRQLVSILDDGWKVLSRDQSVGLADKNGKEIFEGDIVRHESGRIEEIAFINSSFCFKHMEEYQTLDSVFLNIDLGMKNLYIAGNIHENPDLLTKN
jgi:uncharacterized phage protein (TIGR01671 family)